MLYKEYYRLMKGLIRRVRQRIPVNLEKYKVKNPLFIEFVGNPGVGKSTVYNQVNWRKCRCLPSYKFLWNVRRGGVKGYFPGFRGWIPNVGGNKI